MIAIKTQSAKKRGRLALFLASSLTAAAAAGPAAASDNAAEFPNIFRAFETNASGIQALPESALPGVPSFAHAGTAADISRLPAVDRQPVLWGEFDYISWPFFVTTADLSDTVTVNIVFQNAASVMPEVSTLELLVNGMRLGKSVIRNPASPGTLTAEIPAGALMAGYNALTVIARQHHRVDCSADATYELWTSIDVERSTIAFGGNRPRINSMQDLAGLAADRNQALPIRLHFPENEVLVPWGERSARYFAMAQQAAVVRGLRKTDVAVANAANTRMHQPGLDLFYGSVTELAAAPEIARLYDLAEVETRLNAAPSNTVFVPSRDRRRTLMLQARQIAQLQDAFEAYQAQPLSGSDAGIALARANAFETFENTTVSLRELGYIENDFVGRRFATTIGFRLPADFFPGAYDEIAFHMFGLYSDGLKQGQNVLIRINGQSEVTLPLNHRRGGVFEDKIVELELDRFQPGYNEIEVVAFVERPSDDACAPGTGFDNEPRFFLSGDSFLSIPKLAHMGRFPNLGATLSTGYPYRSEDGRGDLDVVLADDQPETLARAISFVAAMAAQTDEVYPVRPSLPSTTPGTGLALNRIMVGGYEALPVQYASQLQGADIQEMVAYWANPNVDVAMANVDVMRTSALGDGGGGPMGTGIIDLPAAVPTGSTVDLLGSGINGESGQSVRERFQRQARERREKSAFMVMLDRLRNFVTKPVRALQPRAADEDRVPRSASAVLGQVVEGNTLTTVVGYAQTGAATAPIDGFFQPGGIRDDLVQTAGLQLTDTAVVAVEAMAPSLSVTDDYSIRNLRLIVAGVLSNNPIIYGVLTIIAFLLAGFVSHMALNRTERRAGQNFETLEFK